MSDAEPEEVSVVVERAGITVEKSFEPDDFPVPAIAFVIRSDRDDPADIRIVDSVPEDVPTQDIGFHPKYGADFWDHEDDQIVFEREFGAGEEYTTVYGLRAKDTEDIDRFLSEPAIEGVGEEESVGDIIGQDADEGTDDGEAEAAAEDGDDAVDTEESDASGVSLDLEEPDGAEEPEEPDAAADDGPEPRAEASADDREAAVGTVDEEGEEAAEEPEHDTDGIDGVDVAVDEVETTGDDERNGHESVAVEAVTPDDLAAALAEEIRAGEVDDDDLETLRDALGAEFDADAVEVEAGVPGSLEARIEKLQSDVSEVAAYTEALESFLDESGSADELLAMHEDVESMRGSVGSLEGTVSGLEDRLASVESTADHNADHLEALETTVEDLDDGLDEIHGDISALQDDLATMEEELGTDLDARVEDIETQLDDMEEDIETLENLRQALTGGS